MTTEVRAPAYAEEQWPPSPTDVDDILERETLIEQPTETGTKLPLLNLDVTVRLDAAEQCEERSPDWATLDEEPLS